MMTSAITLTFGDVAENHVGMQKIGQMSDGGFTQTDLIGAKEKFEAIGCKVELVDLRDGVKEAGIEVPEAYVMIVRNAFEKMTGLPQEELFKEHIGLKWDTKAKMRGRVVNKKARYNLCYSEEAQEPDYENGKGRIVSYSKIPLTKKIQEELPKFIGDKAKGLVCEGNLYYDTNKTGIGFHGDFERRKVVAIRIGNEIPFVYHWFYRSKPVGEYMEVMIRPGDLYIMSDKAVGYDWNKRIVYTLRHAAGCKKYTVIKKKK